MSLPRTPPPQKTVVSNHENETKTFVSTNENADNPKDRNSVTNNQHDDVANNSPDENDALRIAFGQVDPEPQPSDFEPEASPTGQIYVGQQYDASLEDLIKQANKISTPQNSQPVATDPEDSPITKVSKSYTV